MKIIAVISYILFALAFAGLYYMSRKNTYFRMKPGPYAIGWILSTGLILRLIIAVTIEGFSSDIGLFSYWAQQAADDLFHIYQGDFFWTILPFIFMCFF